MTSPTIYRYAVHDDVPTVPRTRRRSGEERGELVQTARFFVSGHIVTADQPDKFLRMHVMAVAVGNVLLRHRTPRAAVCDRIFLLLKFGGYPAQVGRSHGQLLASWN